MVDTPRMKQAPIRDNRANGVGSVSFCAVICVGASLNNGYGVATIGPIGVGGKGASVGFTTSPVTSLKPYQGFSAGAGYLLTVNGSASMDQTQFTGAGADVGVGLGAWFGPTFNFPFGQAE